MGQYWWTKLLFGNIDNLKILRQNLIFHIETNLRLPIWKVWGISGMINNYQCWADRRVWIIDEIRTRVGSVTRFSLNQSNKLKFLLINFQFNILLRTPQHCHRSRPHLPDKYKWKYKRKDYPDHRKSTTLFPFELDQHKITSYKHEMFS